MRRRDLVLTLAATTVVGALVVLTLGALVLYRDDAGDDAPIVRSAPDRVPVLCYHYVRDPSGPLHFVRVFGYVVLSLPLLDDSELWKVNTGNFERQMEYLAARGYRTVTLEDVHEWQHGRRELPPQPVVITFDDGDASVYYEAFPVLKRLGLRATMFVVTGRVGSRWGDVDCLDWTKLKEMQASGVFDIQSHTNDLHYKVTARGETLPVFVAASTHGHTLPAAADWRGALLEDLTRSRDTIKLNTGRAPEFLAWPYGFGNPLVDQVAYEAGFVRTLALRARAAGPLLPGGTNTDDTETFEIPRYTVTARTSLREFRAMLDGVYAPAN